MEQPPSHMAFKCLNPECQKNIRIRIPTKTGVYKIACPHCGTVKNIKLKGLDAFGSQKEDGVAPGNGNSARQTIDLGDDFYIKQSYTVKCPHCQEEGIDIYKETPGQGIALCPKCKGCVEFTARKPTETIIKSESIQRFRGRLVLLRRGWINKGYHLKDGSNIVGRYDESKVSDVSIKGDSSMSRQSVEIFVEHHDKGYSFKLTVRNSTNPVLHNNKPLAAGDSISLNFGDSIILGRTKFRFEKDV